MGQNQLYFLKDYHKIHFVAVNWLKQQTPGFPEKIKKNKIRKLLKCQIEFTGFKQNILLKLQVVIIWLLQMAITNGYYKWLLLGWEIQENIKMKILSILEKLLKKSLKKNIKYAQL